jgi:hypothetical protein
MGRMGLTDQLLSAAIGIVGGGASAYLALRMKARSERRAWERETALKMAHARAEALAAATARSTHAEKDDAAADDSKRGLMPQVDPSATFAEQFGPGVLIVHLSATERDRVFLRPLGRLLIGRDGAADVCLKREVLATRRHAFVETSEDGTVTCIDLATPNGTFVNGVRIEKQQRLYTGDVIKIGTTRIVLAMFK